MTVRLSVAPEEQELKLGRVRPRLCRGAIPGYPDTLCFSSARGHNAIMLLVLAVSDHASDHCQSMHLIADWSIEMG